MGRRSRRCSLQSSPSRTPAIRPRTTRRPDLGSRWRSTAIPPTAPGASWTRSSRPTWRSCARSRRRTRPAAATRRTRFRSTWRRARSPAPPDRPLGCGRSRTGTSPTSATRALACPLADRCTTSTDRPLDPRRPLRATASACSRAADRPGVEGRLHSDPPEGRAQDQSSDATPPRRPPRPRPRAHQSRCRLLAAGCRGEPRQARDARCHPPHLRVCGQYRLTPERAGHTTRSAPIATREGTTRPTPGQPKPQRSVIPPTSTTANRPPDARRRTSRLPKRRSTPAS